MTAAIMLMTILGSDGWFAAIAAIIVDFSNNYENPALQTLGYSGIVKHNVGE